MLLFVNQFWHQGQLSMTRAACRPEASPDLQMKPQFQPCTCGNSRFGSRGCVRVLSREAAAQLGRVPRACPVSPDAGWCLALKIHPRWGYLEKKGAFQSSACLFVLYPLFLIPLTAATSMYSERPRSRPLAPACRPCVPHPASQARTGPYLPLRTVGLRGCPCIARTSATTCSDRPKRGSGAEVSPRSPPSRPVFQLIPGAALGSVPYAARLCARSTEIAPMCEGHWKEAESSPRAAPQMRKHVGSCPLGQHPA